MAKRRFCILPAKKHVPVERRSERTEIKAYRADGRPQGTPPGPDPWLRSLLLVPGPRSQSWPMLHGPSPRSRSPILAPGAGSPVLVTSPNHRPWSCSHAGTWAHDDHSCTNGLTNRMLYKCPIRASFSNITPRYNTKITSPIMESNGFAEKNAHQYVYMFPICQKATLQRPGTP